MLGPLSSGEPYMSNRVFNVAILAMVFVGVLSATPAQAQATRTWVSGVGDDANPCSRTAPCKTFAGAISKTAVAGEINVLDPGGFGGVTITKPITISAEGVEAGVLVSGTNAIIISINPVTHPNADVTLRGLDIEGLGTGLNGITITSTSSPRVTVDRCIIHNFTQNGINIAGAAGARVMVKDSIITKTNIGVNLNGAGGAAVTGLVMNTTIDLSGVAINVAAGGTLFLGGSRLLGSPTSVANAGIFNSFGDNAIQTTGTPTNTIVLK
jgi:hypothetical protein